MAIARQAVFDSASGELALRDGAGNNISSCIIPLAQPLTLTAREAGSTVTLNLNGTLTNTYETSTNGETWSSYTLGTQITLANVGDKVLFRCSSHPDLQTDKNYVNFAMSGTIAASGNLSSMLRSDFRWNSSVSDFCFRSLFHGCTSLVQAPQLPATTLASSCYKYLFYGCTSLTQAPALPAMSLANSCYQYMFGMCGNAEHPFNPPDLPATTLANSCYQSMFYMSTLSRAPRMMGTVMGEMSCLEMFNTAAFPVDAVMEVPAATSLANKCYQSMFLRSGIKGVSCAALDNLTTTYYASWLGQTVGNFFADPSAQWLLNESGIPSSWNRYIYGAVDTGETATMYLNGSSVTVRVGTSSYGACYSVTGWAGFRTLAQMHDLGYTFGEQEAITMYDWDIPVSAVSCAASGEDGFSEVMYKVHDVKDYTLDLYWMSIAQLNEKDYYLTAQEGERPLTFRSHSDNSPIRLVSYGSPNGTYQTQRNGTGSWTSYTLGTQIVLNKGEIIRFKSSSAPTNHSISNYVKFVITQAYPFSAYGQIGSMVMNPGSGHTVGNNYQLYRLFHTCWLLHAPDLPDENVPVYGLANLYYQCRGLKSAPPLSDKQIDTSGCALMFYQSVDLVNPPALPATKIAIGCYQQAFEGCTRLAQAPALPAMSLEGSCYQRMFFGCTALTKTPELPATNLVANCYSSMFQNCTSLNEVRVRATSDAVGNALTNWLSGVAGSGSFYCDPSAGKIFPADSASGIPTGWTRLDIKDYPQS